MDCQENRTNYLISAREKQIIETLAHGYTEKEIADQLCISPKTVSNHLDSIRKKIGVTKNTEIIAYYVATLRGKEFSLHKLREYGISIFILFVNVCIVDV